MPGESEPEMTEFIKPQTIELPRAALEFNQLLLEAAILDGIDPRLARRAKVLVPERWIKQGLPDGSSLTELAKFARNQRDPNGVPLPCTIYYIFTGDWWRNRSQRVKRAL